MTELRNCPFCGGEAKRIDIDATNSSTHDAGGSYIACGKCYACSPIIFGEKTGLEESWNRRALSTIDPDASETGWMIEKHNPMPMWWNGCPKREGNGAWSSEPNDGIRFSRKVDAELCAIAQGFSLSKVLITDHRWG